MRLAKIRNHIIKYGSTQNKEDSKLDISVLKEKIFILENSEGTSLYTKEEANKIAEELKGWMTLIENFLDSIKKAKEEADKNRLTPESIKEMNQRKNELLKATNSSMFNFYNVYYSKGEEVKWFFDNDMKAKTTSESKKILDYIEKEYQKLENKEITAEEYLNHIASFFSSIIIGSFPPEIMDALYQTYVKILDPIVKELQIGCTELIKIAAQKIENVEKFNNYAVGIEQKATEINKVTELIQKIEPTFKIEKLFEKSYLDISEALTWYKEKQKTEEEIIREFLEGDKNPNDFQQQINVFLIASTNSEATNIFEDYKESQKKATPEENKENSSSIDVEEYTALAENFLSSIRKAKEEADKNSLTPESIKEMNQRKNELLKATNSSMFNFYSIYYSKEEVKWFFDNDMKAKTTSESKKILDYIEKEYQKLENEEITVEEYLNYLASFFSSIIIGDFSPEIIDALYQTYVKIFESIVKELQSAYIKLINPVPQIGEKGDKFILYAKKIEEKATEINKVTERIQKIEPTFKIENLFEKKYLDTSEALTWYKESQKKATPEENKENSSSIDNEEFKKTREEYKETIDKINQLTKEKFPLLVGLYDKNRELYEKVINSSLKKGEADSHFGSYVAALNLEEEILSLERRLAQLDIESYEKWQRSVSLYEKSRISVMRQGNIDERLQAAKERIESLINYYTNSEEEKKECIMNLIMIEQGTMTIDIMNEQKADSHFNSFEYQQKYIPNFSFDKEEMTQKENIEQKENPNVVVKILPIRFYKEQTVGDEPILSIQDDMKISIMSNKLTIAFNKGLRDQLSDIQYALNFSQRQSNGAPIFPSINSTDSEEIRSYDLTQIDTTQFDLSIVLTNLIDKDNSQIFNLIRDGVLNKENLDELESVEPMLSR